MLYLETRKSRKIFGLSQSIRNLKQRFLELFLLQELIFLVAYDAILMFSWIDVEKFIFKFSDVFSREYEYVTYCMLFYATRTLNSCSKAVLEHFIDFDRSFPDFSLKNTGYGAWNIVRYYWNIVRWLICAEHLQWFVGLFQEHFGSSVRWSVQFIIINSTNEFLKFSVNDDWSSVCEVKNEDFAFFNSKERLRKYHED